MPQPPTRFAETLLHQSDRTRVSRGRRTGIDRTVIIKQLRPRAAMPAAIARLRHEHKLGQELSGTVVQGALERTLDHGEPPLWRLRFTHAEIRNAVHEQLDETRPGELHLRIGTHLAERAVDSDEAALREGVAQLDLVWRLGETADPDALELARLNLLAGRSALYIARPRSAYQYLRTGPGLLGADAWQAAGELALALTVAAMEADRERGIRARWSAWDAWPSSGHPTGRDGCGSRRGWPW